MARGSGTLKEEMFRKKETEASGPAGMTLLGLSTPGPERTREAQVEIPPPPPFHDEPQHEDEPGMSVLGLSEMRPVLVAPAPSGNSIHPPASANAQQESIAHSSPTDENEGSAAELVPPAAVM